MYHVRTTTGITLGYVDYPKYVKRSGNTTIVECGESDALGIFLNSTLYHIYGRAAMTGASTEVVIEKVDGGEVAFNTAKTNGDVYNPSTSYTKGSYFIYNNVVYKVKVACSGITPPNSTYYDAVTIGSELSSLKSEIDTLNGSSESFNNRLKALEIYSSFDLKLTSAGFYDSGYNPSGYRAASRSVSYNTDGTVSLVATGSGSQGAQVATLNYIDPIYVASGRVLEITFSASANRNTSLIRFGIVLSSAKNNTDGFTMDGYFETINDATSGFVTQIKNLVSYGEGLKYLSFYAHTWYSGQAVTITISKATAKYTT